MRIWIAAMLVGLLSCAGPGSQVASVKLVSAGNRSLENLQRAAKLPWLDDGTCAVREAAGEWRMLAERCYHALDLSRIQFRDVDHRCPVAQTNVAAVQVVVGICLLAALELAVDAVIVTDLHRPVHHLHLMRHQEEAPAPQPRGTGAPLLSVGGPGSNRRPRAWEGHARGPGSANLADLLGTGRALRARESRARSRSASGMHQAGGHDALKGRLDWATALARKPGAAWSLLRRKGKLEEARRQSKVLRPTNPANGRPRRLVKAPRTEIWSPTDWWAGT